MQLVPTGSDSQMMSMSAEVLEAATARVETQMSGPGRHDDTATPNINIYNPSRNYLYDVKYK